MIILKIFNFINRNILLSILAIVLIGNFVCLDKVSAEYYVYPSSSYSYNVLLDNVFVNTLPAIDATMNVWSFSDVNTLWSQVFVADTDYLLSSTVYVGNFNYSLSCTTSLWNTSAGVPTTKIIDGNTLTVVGDWNFQILLTEWNTTLVSGTEYALTVGCFSDDYSNYPPFISKEFTNVIVTKPYYSIDLGANWIWRDEADADVSIALEFQGGSQTLFSVSSTLLLLNENFVSTNNLIWKIANKDFATTTAMSYANAEIFCNSSTLGTTRLPTVGEVKAKYLTGVAWNSIFYTEGSPYYYGWAYDEDIFNDTYSQYLRIYNVYGVVVNYLAKTNTTTGKILACVADNWTVSTTYTALAYVEVEGGEGMFNADTIVGWLNSAWQYITIIWLSVIMLLIVIAFILIKRK